MSLLNRPSDGTHSVLVVIYKLLLQEGAMERARIVELCSPSTAIPPRANDTPMVGKTITTWLQLGLLEESQTGNIGIHKNVARADRALEDLPRIARRLVLAESNNPNLWGKEGVRAGDFTRALAWLLAQDVNELAFTGWAPAEEVLKRQLPESLGLVQNDTRWVGLKAWTRWLGFGWMGRHPNGLLVVDPTDAVRDALSTIFVRRKTMTAPELMASLADQVPVLDGGSYRLQVEEKLRDRKGAHAWKPLPESQVSTSLSRAFLRLANEGTLLHERKSDAPDRIILTGRNQSALDTVTHFTFNS